MVEGRHSWFPWVAALLSDWLVLSSRKSRKRGEFLEWLWSNTEKTSEGCWVWQGAKNDSGYGYVRYEGRMVGVHRVVYRLTGHDLFPGDAVNHRCRTRLCINPDHLNAASTRENSLDALQHRALTSRIDQLESALAEVVRVLSGVLGTEGVARV